MGRIGRQRKLKNVDPFAKSQPVLTGMKYSKKYDLAPKHEDFEPDDDSVPRKAKQLMKLTKMVASGSKGISKKKQKSKKAKSPNILSKKPGESKKQFFDRLDRQVSDALNKALVETKKIREKRKVHLKKHDEKRKSKKSKLQETFPVKELPKQDQVRFGEVVSQPPTLSAAPRKAKSQKASLDLKLLDVVKGGDATKDVSMDKLYKIKRKEMTDKMKKALDDERKTAIAEYRKMKQRKILRT